jgi:hypothetical protein
MKSMEARGMGKGKMNGDNSADSKNHLDSKTRGLRRDDEEPLRPRQAGQQQGSKHKSNKQ